MLHVNLADFFTTFVLIFLPIITLTVLTSLSITIVKQQKRQSQLLQQMNERLQWQHATKVWDKVSHKENG